MNYRRRLCPGIEALESRCCPSPGPFSLFLPGPALVNLVPPTPEQVLQAAGNHPGVGPIQQAEDTALPTAVPDVGRLPGPSFPVPNEVNAVRAPDAPADPPGGGPSRPSFPDSSGQPGSGAGGERVGDTPPEQGGLEHGRPAEPPGPAPGAGGLEGELHRADPFPGAPPAGPPGGEGPPGRTQQSPDGGPGPHGPPSFSDGPGQGGSAAGGEPARPAAPGEPARGAGPAGEQAPGVGRTSHPTADELTPRGEGPAHQGAFAAGEEQAGLPPGSAPGGGPVGSTEPSSEGDSVVPSGTAQGAFAAGKESAGPAPDAGETFSRTSGQAPETGPERRQPDGASFPSTDALPAHRPGEQESPAASILHLARPEGADPPGRGDEAGLVARQTSTDAGGPPSGPEFAHVFSTTSFQAHFDDSLALRQSGIDVGSPPSGPEFAEVLSTTTHQAESDDLFTSAGSDESEVEARPAGELAAGWLARDLAAVDQSLRAFLEAVNCVGERLGSLLGPAYLDWWYAACGAGLSAAALTLYSMRRGRGERDPELDGALAWSHPLALSDDVG
jgi:hypothetical protein